PRPSPARWLREKYIAGLAAGCHSFQAWLSPRLSRSARRDGLHGFLCRRFRRRLHRGLARFSRFCLGRLRIAEVSRRVRAAGAFARAEARNRPNRFDTRSRRGPLRNRALPLRPYLLAIVSSTVDARLRKLRRGQG